MFHTFNFKRIKVWDLCPSINQIPRRATPYIDLQLISSEAPHVNSHHAPLYYTLMAGVMHL